MKMAHDGEKCGCGGEFFTFAGGKLICKACKRPWSAPNAEIRPRASGSVQTPSEPGKRQDSNPARPVGKKISNRYAMTSEKQFQQDAEKWLHIHGYQRLCAGLIDIRIPTKGYFGHWFESQRNAFMPDLLILPWPNNRPALLLELKVRNKYQPGQKEAIDAGLWIECRNLDEVIAAVAKWENKMAETPESEK